MCLVKRNHTYYFRRRYPVDVAELIESHEICRSLKTKVRSQALSRASKLEASQQGTVEEGLLYVSGEVMDQDWIFFGGTKIRRLATEAACSKAGLACLT